MSNPEIGRRRFFKGFGGALANLAQEGINLVTQDLGSSLTSFRDSEEEVQRQFQLAGEEFLPVQEGLGEVTGGINEVLNGVGEVAKEIRDAWDEVREALPQWRSRGGSKEGMIYDSQEPSSGNTSVSLEETPIIVGAGGQGDLILPLVAGVALGTSVSRVGEGLISSLSDSSEGIEGDLGNLSGDGGKKIVTRRNFLRGVAAAAGAGLVAAACGPSGSGNPGGGETPVAPTGERNSSSENPTATTEYGTGGPTEHVVQSGDTLYGIGRNYGVSVQNLLDFNSELRRRGCNLEDCTIYPGDVISLVPPETQASEQERAGVGGGEESRDELHRWLESRGIETAQQKPCSVFGVNMVRIERNHEYNPNLVSSISQGLDQEIKERTYRLLSAMSGTCSIDPKTEPETYRDMIRWLYGCATQFNEYHTVVKEVGYSDSLALDIYSILAKNELRCVRNPGVQQIFDEVVESGAVVAVNRLVREKVPPELFKDGFVPQIPSTREGLLEITVFTGSYTPNEFGPGSAYPNAPTLLGAGYCSLNQANSEQMNNARKAIACTLFHEFGHTNWQANSKSPGGMTPSEALFIHDDVHSILCDMATRAMGLETGYQPEFLNWESVVVYGVLKEAGVNDPLVPMITSLATLTPFDIYDQVRKSGDPSLEEIVSAGHILDRLPGQGRERAIELYDKYADEFVTGYTRYIP